VMVSNFSAHRAVATGKRRVVVKRCVGSRCRTTLKVHGHERAAG
jgi:hypothetical protein